MTISEDNPNLPEELVASAMREKKEKDDGQITPYSFGATKIVLNSIRTPDGTVLMSKDEHDFVRYTDKNGLRYAIDGGNVFLKRMCAGEYEELSEYEAQD
tara:strand:+ start:603 stop:902 length:300 start_codon:yes stop_codon:yes gene_type:complete